MSLHGTGTRVVIGSLTVAVFFAALGGSVMRAEVSADTGWTSQVLCGILGFCGGRAPAAAPTWSAAPAPHFGAPFNTLPQGAAPATRPAESLTQPAGAIPPCLPQQHNISIETPDGQTLALRSSVPLLNVNTLSAEETGVSFPHGTNHIGYLTSFEAIGSEVTVTLPIPEGMQGQDDIHLVRYANDQFTRVQNALIGATTITTTIRDNGEGDLDPRVNRIRDPLGPGSGGGAQSGNQDRLTVSVNPSTVISPGPFIVKVFADGGENGEKLTLSGLHTPRLELVSGAPEGAWLEPGGMIRLGQVTGRQTYSLVFKVVNPRSFLPWLPSAPSCQPIDFAIMGFLGTTTRTEEVPVKVKCERTGDEGGMYGPLPTPGAPSITLHVPSEPVRFPEPFKVKMEVDSIPGQAASAIIDGFPGTVEFVYPPVPPCVPDIPCHRPPETECRYQGRTLTCSLPASENAERRAFSLEFRMIPHLVCQEATFSLTARRNDGATTSPQDVKITCGNSGEQCPAGCQQFCPPPRVCPPGASCAQPLLCRQCPAGCTRPSAPTFRCGDGTQSAGEECDMGKRNGAPDATCDGDCKIKVNFCGNNRVERGEQCDGGANCNSDCTLKADLCNSCSTMYSCQVPCRRSGDGQCVAGVACPNPAPEYSREGNCGGGILYWIRSPNNRFILAHLNYPSRKGVHLFDIANLSNITSRKIEIPELAGTWFNAPVSNEGDLYLISLVPPRAGESEYSTRPATARKYTYATGQLSASAELDTAAFWAANPSAPLSVGSVRTEISDDNKTVRFTGYLNRYARAMYYDIENRKLIPERGTYKKAEEPYDVNALAALSYEIPGGCYNGARGNEPLTFLCTTKYQFSDKDHNLYGYDLYFIRSPMERAGLSSPLSDFKGTLIADNKGIADCRVWPETDYPCGRDHPIGDNWQEGCPNAGPNAQYEGPFQICTCTPTGPSCDDAFCS